MFEIGHYINSTMASVMNSNIFHNIIGNPIVISLLLTLLVLIIILTVENKFKIILYVFLSALLFVGLHFYTIRAKYDNKLADDKSTHLVSKIGVLTQQQNNDEAYYAPIIGGDQEIKPVIPNLVRGIPEN